MVFEETMIEQKYLDGLLGDIGIKGCGKSESIIIIVDIHILMPFE